MKFTFLASGPNSECEEIMRLSLVIQITGDRVI